MGWGVEEGGGGSEGAKGWRGVGGGGGWGEGEGKGKLTADDILFALPDAPLVCTSLGH